MQQASRIAASGCKPMDRLVRHMAPLPTAVLQLLAPRTAGNDQHKNAHPGGRTERARTENNDGATFVFLGVAT
eukprot:2207330-Lingulodinium_polyedra.AAC.1